MKIEGDEYIIDGSSFKGKVPTDYMLGTWWNHNIIKAKAQISAISGRIIEQNVKFLGKEKITIGDYTRIISLTTVMDTNVHFIKDIKTGKINTRIQ